MSPRARSGDTPEVTEDDPGTGGTVWDAPNQQVVREDASAPWEEGTGGGGDDVTVEPASSAPPPDDTPDEPTRVVAPAPADDDNGAKD
jgi:hypothetical protein